MELEIRRLQDADVEALSIIEQESFSMPWSAQDFRDLLSRDYCLYMVAVTDGQVVGCAGLTESFGEGNIDNVVIAGAYRSRGIGKRLLAELLQEGEKQGIEAFTLEVRVSNAAAIHVYESLGFVSEGIRPHFYERPVEDAMIMWRR